MSTDILTGTALVLLGGIFMGSFLVPSRATKAWAWENYWFVYALCGVLLFPWVLALATTPSAGEVITRTGWKTLGLVLLFGTGWGLGSVLFGLGVKYAGMVLGFSIILGLTFALGVFVPMVVLKPEELGTPAGLWTTAGVLIMVAGVIVIALAGRMKGGLSDGTEARPFKLGLTICILSGILNPMLNFAFAFRGEMADNALSTGTSESSSKDLVWAVALSGGLIPNAGYAAYLLSRRRTWRAYVSPSARWWYWPCGAAIGLLWYGGPALYGRGAHRMGELGESLGWGILMASVIIASSFWGILLGEWRGAPGRARRALGAGLGLLLGAIAFLGYAAHLG